MNEEVTDDTDDSGGPFPRRSSHLGDLELRRLHAGEILGEGLEAHVAACADCARRLEAVLAEQRQFEARISFDRFAAGVERAARVPRRGTAPRWWRRPASTRSFVTVMSMGALAACVALVIGVRPLFDAARVRGAADDAVTAAAGANRIKGDMHPSMTVRIAATENGPQRTAASDALEPLALGERIRVGVRPGARRFLFAISIDDHGTVTPLYPEVGTSMPLPRGGGLQYLPDSLELTGKGQERLIVLLSDVPLELDNLQRAAAEAFRRAGGDLGRLQNLNLPVAAADQFHRMFLKP